MNKKHNVVKAPEAVYQSITDAIRVTGLSDNYLRAGCKAGTIKHLKIGRKYMINVPALLADLEKTGVM